MRSSFAGTSGLVAAVLWLVASPAGAGDWQSEGGRETLRREFAIQPDQEIRFDLNWGELHVEAATAARSKSSYAPHVIAIDGAIARIVSAPSKSRLIHATAGSLSNSAGFRLGTARASIWM